MCVITSLLRVIIETTASSTHTEMAMELVGVVDWAWSIVETGAIVLSSSSETSVI